MNNKMERKKEKICLVFLFSVLMATNIVAQKTMDVSKFTRMENDLMARVTKPVRDNDEGKLCALIRVVTTLSSLEFRADALGIVHQEKHSGEIWLYVPYGAKSISFSHEGYFPLLYQYALPIEEGTVYELRLSSYDAPAAGAVLQTNTQMFVLTHTPEDARVYIDDMKVPTEYGVFSAMMSKGIHSYKVEADQYEDAEGTFELEDQPVRETVNLEPLFATIQLFTLPENDFDISLNGQHVGVSPYKSGRLEAGSYSIRIEKKDYYPIDTIVRLREGDNVELTCKLTSFTDSLFYKHELGGRKVSWGLNVGYLIPFVSSKASGGFTGSPINYAFGNSSENVSYSSQWGFTAGAFADIKTYRNLYLIVGANYSQYCYTNKFSQPIYGTIIQIINQYADKGNMINNYKEEYTLRCIELPIMASYRFLLSRKSSLHLNMGPYMGCGISAKMKLSGSTECQGISYPYRNGQIDESHSYGTFLYSYHIDGNINLYDKTASYTKVIESGQNLGYTEQKQFQLNDAPLKRLYFGIKAGVTYELRGFQIGVAYSLQLSNMANSAFYESARIPVFNKQTTENNMSGYKHRVHSMELKLGYVFRY